MSFLSADCATEAQKFQAPARQSVQLHGLHFLPSFLPPSPLSLSCCVPTNILTSVTGLRRTRKVHPWERKATVTWHFFFPCSAKTLDESSEMDVPSQKLQMNGGSLQFPSGLTGFREGGEASTNHQHPIRVKRSWARPDMMEGMRRGQSCIQADFKQWGVGGRHHWFYLPAWLERPRSIFLAHDFPPVPLYLKQATSRTKR